MAKLADGAEEGVLDIGGKYYNLSAQVMGGDRIPGKTLSFSEPVAVTINCSDLKLTNEQIKELCGVKLVKDAQGKFTRVPLGGKYNADDQTFTFYTDEPALLTFIQKNDLKKIEIGIGNTSAVVDEDTREVDVPPTIINNRTMVPLRFIGEVFGASFAWDEQTRSVTYQLGNKVLKLVIDQPLDGFDTPQTIVQGRTMVPLRYISEAFDAYVLWFPSDQSISVVK